LLGSIPTEFGKLINLTELLCHSNKLTGKPRLPISPVLRSSLPLADHTSEFNLAGSIPTEFGKLVNMAYLDLENNELTGKCPCAHLALV
jgi:hypothetical protein